MGKRRMLVWAGRARGMHWQRLAGQPGPPPHLAQGQGSSQSELLFWWLYCGHGEAWRPLPALASACLTNHSYLNQFPPATAKFQACSWLWEQNCRSSPRNEDQEYLTARRAKTQLHVLIPTCWRKAPAFTEVNLVLVVFRCLIQMALAIKNASVCDTAQCSVKPLWVFFSCVYMLFVDMNGKSIFENVRNYSEWTFYKGWKPLSVIWVPSLHPPKQASR